MGNWNFDGTRYYPVSVVTRHSHDDDFHVQAATDALTRPDDFGYFGDLPLFESWGLTFAQTRDSDVLDRSNYRTVFAYLKEVAELHVNDSTTLVEEIHCGHWACGWIDQLAVRVLINETGEVTPDNITHVFKVASDIARGLTEEFPIFDETDYSELESEEHFESWEDWVWPNFKREQGKRDDWNGPGGTLREESDYLDAMGAESLIYFRVDAPEHDPSTWAEHDIMAGVVLAAEELAHDEDETRVPAAWWRDGDDAILDDGVFLVLDTHAHSHGGYVHTVNRAALRDALTQSARVETITHDRDVLARHNLLGNRVTTSTDSEG